MEKQTSSNNQATSVASAHNERRALDAYVRVACELLAAAPRRPFAAHYPPSSSGSGRYSAASGGPNVLPVRQRRRTPLKFGSRYLKPNLR